MTSLFCERFVLTVDAGTGGVAAVKVEESVSVSDASSPKEFFAFVVNRIIVVSQIVAATLTCCLFKVASFSGCEEETSSSLSPLSSLEVGIAVVVVYS